MSWTVKIAMYGWTEHPEYTPDLEKVDFNRDGTERMHSSRHRISEIMVVELVDRGAEQATVDALKVISALRADQVNDHLTKMQSLKDAEAKYLSLTHQPAAPFNQDIHGQPDPLESTQEFTSRVSEVIGADRDAASSSDDDIPF